MKAPRPFDDEEIERYESPKDYVAIVLTIIMMIIGIALIFWTPDVEVIGTWIYELFN